MVGLWDTKIGLQLVARSGGEKAYGLTNGGEKLKSGTFFQRKFKIFTESKHVENEKNKKCIIAFVQKCTALVQTIIQI